MRRCLWNGKRGSGQGAGNRHCFLWLVVTHWCATIINGQPGAHCSLPYSIVGGKEIMLCLYWTCLHVSALQRETEGESVRSPGQSETQTWDLGSVLLWPCLLIKCQTYFSTPEEKKSTYLRARIARRRCEHSFRYRWLAPLGLCVCVGVCVCVCVWIKVRSIIRDASVWGCPFSWILHKAVNIDVTTRYNAAKNVTVTVTSIGSSDLLHTGRFSLDLDRNSKIITWKTTREVELSNNSILWRKSQYSPGCGYYNIELNLKS